MIALLALAAVAPAPQPAAPQPEALKTFRDWIVGCDNARACKAVALVPEAEDGEHYLMLVLERGAEASAKATLSGTQPDGPPRRATLSIDGKPIAQIGGTVVFVDTTLAAALAAGSSAEVATTPGGKVGTASLGGLAAAMRYIDDRQKRVGTVTALVAKGAATAVPRMPALPAVSVPRTPSTPPRMLTVKAATALIGRDGAVCDYAAFKVEPEAYRLDARTSLSLVNQPCGNGAYNFYFAAFLIDESGKARPATYDTDKPHPKDGENLGLVNAGFDPKTRRLSSMFKGRGIGDCGTGQTYVWDGIRFRLVRQEQMGECRGSVDTITTWQALAR